MNAPLRQQTELNTTRGFSLIELLVTVAVASLLFSFATPAFERFVQENRRSSTIYGLMNDLQFARSESIKRSARLAVCARKPGTVQACDDTAPADWGEGWLVFTDNGDDVGELEPATETMLRVGSGTEGDLVFSTRARVNSGATNEASVNYVRFGPRGTSNWRGGGFMLLCDRKDGNAERAAAVNVTLSGDIRRARRDGDNNLISAFGTSPVCPTT